MKFILNHCGFAFCRSHCALTPIYQTWSRDILRRNICCIRNSRQYSHHSRRKRSECDFLLCFHLYILHENIRASGVYPQNAKVVPVYRAWRSLSQSPAPVSNLHAPCIGSFLKYAGTISSILRRLCPVSVVWLACLYYTIVFSCCQCCFFVFLQFDVIDKSHASYLYTMH